VLASGGEEKEKVEAYKEGLEKNGKGYLVERREEMVHGWMSARGDLGNEIVRREYGRGYQKLVDFFGKYL
jgi:dienelactone hydrolase